MEILSYKEAKRQYRDITEDPSHRMHGYSRKKFANEAEQLLGDKRFNTLKGGGLNRGLWHLGQFVDNIGQFDLNPWYRGEQSIGSGIGGALAGIGHVFGADDEMKESLMNVGREIPGGLLSYGLMGLASFALTPFVGIPLGAALFYGDAYNDALEEGRSTGEASGSGLINIAFGLTTGGVGNAFKKLGLNLATRSGQRTVAKQFAAAGITDEKMIARVGKKLSKMENKWYKPRESLKVTNWNQPGAQAIRIRPRSKPKAAVIEVGTRFTGDTGYGMVGDILDTWMFNDQLSVGQLLTDPNYLFPMLAGDGMTFIGGDLILNKSKDARVRRLKLNKEVRANLENAKKKILERKNLNFEEWRKTEALEDLPDIELIRIVETEDNVLGDVTYKWVDTAGMDRQPESPLVELELDKGRVPSPPGAGTLTELGRKQAEEAPGIVSYRTDENGRIFDVSTEIEGDEDLLFLALRRQMGIGTGDDTAKFATFEYVRKADGSDQPFVDNVLSRFAQVDEVSPGILRISDIHTIHDESDTRRRAARHMEYWEDMPITQEYQHFVERYIRAAQMGGIPTSMLRNEARRVFQFYRSKGLGDDMAMRLSLRLVERSGFQTFYDIYYGDAEKTDTDLARVIRQDVVHSGREGSYLQRGWGVDHSNAPGLVFYHDPETRTTMKFVAGSSGTDQAGAVIKVYRAGVEVNTITHGGDASLRKLDAALAAGEITPREHQARRDALINQSEVQKDARLAIEGFEDKLTIDQQSALTLAVGQANEVSTPGVTFGKGIRDNERSVINNLAQGLGFGDEGVLADNHRLIVVAASDLSDPVALRELGLPVLGLYANTLRSRSTGAFIHTLRHHEGADTPGSYLIVLNDHVSLGHDVAASQFSREWSLVHEFGHFIHYHITNRPEFAQLDRELHDAWLEDLARYRKKMGSKAIRKKWEAYAKLHGLDPAAEVPPLVKELLPFSAERLITGSLPLDPVTGEAVFSPADIDTLTGHTHTAQFAEYLINKNEWMAENFTKYIKKKGSPANTSVEKFFKSTVEMWEKLVGTVFGRRIDPKTGKPGALHPSALPPKAYNELMGMLQQDFYTKLARKRHPETVKRLKTKYNLTEEQSNHLHSKLWESDYHPDMLQGVENALDLWVVRGKGTNFNEKVNQALRDHKRRATLAADPSLVDPTSDEKKRLDKWNEIFFGMENVIKHGETVPSYYSKMTPEEQLAFNEYSEKKREEYREILRTIDRALFGVYVVESRPDLTVEEARKLGYKTKLDPVSYNPGSIVDATAKAQSIVVRWLQGELEAQTGGRPREGGTELLRRTIEKTLRADRKKILETASLKQSGHFEKGGKVEYFTKVENADQFAANLTDTYGNEGYSFEVRSRVNKAGAREFFIVRLHDEYLSRTQFDEKYTQQLDGELSSSTSEHMAEHQLRNLGHSPDVAQAHANRLMPVVRAYPVTGQKVVWGAKPLSRMLVKAGLTDTRRILDAFSGSGFLSNKVRQEGFTGEVVENTLSPLHNQMKQDIRTDVEGFTSRVEEHYSNIENMSAKEAERYLKKQPETDTAALWLAQLFQAQYRELRSVKDLSVNSDRFRYKSSVPNAIAGLRAYAETTSQIVGEDGWDVVKRAERGDLVIVDPPYVGRNYYPVWADEGDAPAKSHTVTLAEQRANLELVWEADRRGAKVMYFDSDPSIRQDFIDRGFRVETVKGDEFVAVNYAEPGETAASKTVAATKLSEGIEDTIARGTDNELLPPELLEQIPGVLEELEANGGQDHMDAIARDFGVESVRDLAELQALVMKNAFADPAETAKKISLLPDKTKNFFRGLLTFSIDLADSVEAQVRKDRVDLEDTGETLSAVEEVKAGLALAAEDQSDIGSMSSVIARLQPGGLKEAEVEGTLWGAPFRWMEKIYSQTLMGLQHLAESHPLIRPASVALYQETGLQNKIYAETTDQFHARIPPVPGDPTADVDYTTTDKDRAFKVVSESPKLSDAFNQLRLLEQVRGKGFGELLAAKDKELMEIFDTLDSTEQQKVADLIQRGHKAQAILTQHRNQVSQEVDRISTAKLLLRKGTGEMTSQEALGIIEKLDAELMKGGDDVLERGAWLLAQEAGIDLGLAESITMFYGRLKGASAEMHQFLVERPWYVSERRMKRFHVSYIQKGDKTTSLADFNTLVEAEDFAADITKAGGTIIRGRPIDTTIQASLRNAGAREMHEVLETAAAKRTAVVEEAFRDSDPEIADELSELFTELVADVTLAKDAQSPLSVLKSGEGKVRKFKGGRERFNMLEQQLDHSRNVAVALARKRTDAIISLTRQDKDAASDRGSALMKLVEKAKENQRSPDPAAGVFMSKFNFAMFLGLNMSSALIEMLQFPLTLTPILMEIGAGHYESFSTPVKLLENARESMMSSRKKEVAGAGWTDPIHIELIRRAEKENRLNIRRYIDVEDDIVLDNEMAYRVGRGEDIRGSLKTWNPFSMAYRLGAKMYAPFNRFNAELSLISVFEVLRKKNPDMDPSNPADFESLYTQSARWADIANGSAGKSNRPIGLFRPTTATLRTLSQTSYALMSFTNAAVGNWMRWIKKSHHKLFTEHERKSSRHALGQAMGLHLVGLGAMGIPLTGAINTIFSNLFGWDMEDTIRDALTIEDESGGVNDFWANFANYGAMHAIGLAPDIQTRMAIGGIAGLNPYSGWDSLAVLGPSASYAVSSVQALQQLPEQGVGRTATNLLPVGVRKAAQLTLTDQGQVRDRANQFITTPTEAEKAAMLLGFRPLRVREQQSRVLEITRAGKAEEKQRRRAVSESLAYLRKGDLRSAQENLINVSREQEGSSYADLYRSFETRYLTEKFGRGYDAGVVTASKISAQGLGRESRPTNEQVYLTRLNLRGAFGMPSRPSRRELQINQRADTFMRNNPFLNPALAKRMARTEHQTDPLRQPFSQTGFQQLFDAFS